MSVGYSGPERRRGRQHDHATRLGQWLLDRAAVLAGALVLMFAMLAVLTFGIVQSNHRADEQLSKLGDLVTAQQRGAEDGAAVIRCILAELASYRVSNAQAHDAIAKLLGDGDLPPPAAQDVTVSEVPDPVATCKRANELFADLPKAQGGKR